MERLHDKLEISIVEARTHPDPAEGLNIAKAATEHFVEQAREVIESETKGYFAGVKIALAAPFSWLRGGPARAMDHSGEIP